MKKNPNKFSYKIKSVLAKRAAYICSYPNCKKITIAPAAEVDHLILIGEAAHIKGAMPRSARYDKNMTSEER